MNDSIATRPLGQTVTAKISGIECIPLNIPFKVPFKIARGAARELMETLKTAQYRRLDGDPLDRALDQER